MVSLVQPVFSVQLVCLEQLQYFSLVSQVQSVEQALWLCWFNRNSCSGVLMLPSSIVPEYKCGQVRDVQTESVS